MLSLKTLTRDSHTPTRTHAFDFVYLAKLYITCTTSINGVKNSYITDVIKRNSFSGLLTKNLNKKRLIRIYLLLISEKLSIRADIHLR